jgi:head-tail adaptor
MAKTANAGEMRTRITVKQLTPGIDADGYPTETWTNVLGGTTMFRCKWKPGWGTEVLENDRLNLGQTAVATLRYTSLIDQRCRVWYENDAQTDANAWFIVNVTDPEERRAFLEITLRKAVVA